MSVRDWLIIRCGSSIGQTISSLSYSFYSVSDQAYNHAWILAQLYFICASLIKTFCPIRNMIPKYPSLHLQVHVPDSHPMQSWLFEDSESVLDQLYFRLPVWLSIFLFVCLSAQPIRFSHTALFPKLSFFEYKMKTDQNPTYQLWWIVPIYISSSENMIKFWPAIPFGTSSRENHNSRHFFQLT